MAVLAMTAVGASALVLQAAQAGRPAASEAPRLDGVWDFSTLTPLQRPARYAAKPYLAGAEAAAFERELRQNADNDRRGTTAEADLRGPGINEFWMERGGLAVVDGRVPTSLVVDPPDGLVPALTPDAERRNRERGATSLRADAPEDRRLSERCLRAASGPPYFPSPDANTLRIVQSRDAVALTAEKFHETRIVLLDGRPAVSAALRSWVGYSRGRWEKDTLVVDTVNFTPTLALSGNLDGNLRLTERFTRVAHDTLRYEVTIDDPTTFVRPWRVVVPMRLTTDPVYEFACHEGNYSLPNILRGARVEERNGSRAQ
jgi:hypothetical protein